MNLPIIKDDNTPFQLMQSKWSSQINPVLSNPIMNGSKLDNITLTTGVNVINHKLSKLMQGWFITDITGAVTVFRSQPFNDKTLVLTASGGCTISLWVF